MKIKFLTVLIALSLLSSSTISQNATDIIRKADELIEFLQDAGLRGFKLHSLRHTFSTALVERNVDIVTISKLLGHQDVKTTMIYAKRQLSVMRSAIVKLVTLPSHGYKMVTNGGGGEEG